MALTISDTTYAGEAASGFIVKAITGSQTVQGGHIYVKDGIKKKFTIPRLSVTDIIQDRAATPTTAGTITVDGRALEPADFMVYNQFNPRDFEDHWAAAQINTGLIDRRLPATAESVVVQEHLKVVANWFDKIIWQGDAAANSSTKLHYFDGIVKKLVTANSAVVSSNLEALTEDNIVEKMADTLALLPDALKYDPTVKFFFNYKSAALYAQAQKNQAQKGVDFTQGGVWQYDGYPVVKIAGMPDNVIVLARGRADMESNLWLGMDSTMDANGDPSQIKLSPLQANSELWFIKMLMKMDVQIGWTEEAVLYRYAA